MRAGVLSVRGVGVALAAAMALGGATLAGPPSREDRQRLRAALRERARRVTLAGSVQGREGRAAAGVGTIQYDNDIPFSRDGNAPYVGNRFNLGFQDPHSIASVSFRRGGANGNYAVASIFDVPVAFLGYGFTFGLPSNTVGSMVIAFPLQLPVSGHSGSFLAVLINNDMGACAGNTMLGAPCNGPALTAGTMDPGMGFHAVRIYATGTNGVDIPNRNAILRVTGNNLPVELMGFGVE